MNFIRGISAVLCFTLLIGCSTKEKAISNQAPTTQFVDKEVTKEKEDGWIAHLYIQVEKKDKNSKQIEGNYDIHKIMNVYYDCVNVRYQKLTGYSIKELDDSGNEIGQFEDVIPTYSRARDKKEDIKNINDFLTEKKFARTITLKDLDEVQCDSLDKKEIVEMYNEAINKKMDEYPGTNSYGGNKEVNSGEITLPNNGKLYLAYIVSMDRISAINIEYIDADGAYLSTLIDEGKADESQKKINQKLNEIEKNIIREQSIEVDVDIEDLPQFKNNINELLKKSITIEKA